VSIHDELQRTRERHEQEKDTKRTRRRRRIVSALIGIGVFLKAEAPYIYGLATGKWEWSWTGFFATIGIVVLIFLIAFWTLHRRTKRIRPIIEREERRRGNRDPAQA